MDNEWDLHAVVRSCATSTSASSAAAADNTPAAMDIEEVHKEGCVCVQSLPIGAVTASKPAVTSISFDDGRSANEHPSVVSNIISFDIIKPVDYSEHHARRRKSKKNKRVAKLREEELNNDGWAWRKYGQKPIKGSPHPRNYYRCSTRQDCLARKQVERSTADASSFIVSYSVDHLHPRPTHLSSLAGTTRTTKFTPVATDFIDQLPCSSSSPASTSSFSPASSLKEDETEFNDDDIDELIKKY